MRAYYNEIDPYAAQWLRNLIAAGHIAPGDVDERSIADVGADDLAGYRQCHFFAGIGVWSYALRLAGWGDDREVWTGSCPCQPFSAAGKGEGFEDERHLWPVWFNLIRECRPGVVFGEQVEAAIRHGWLDLVQADMEGIGYAFAPVGIPAAGFGAPHIRQRLWFVADPTPGGLRINGSAPGSTGHAALGDTVGGVANSEPLRSQRSRHTGSGEGMAVPGAQPARAGADGVMGNTKRTRLEGLAGHGDGDSGQVEAGSVAAAGANGGVDNPFCNGRRTEWGSHAGDDGQQLAAASEVDRPGPVNGHWRDADWIFCRDGKWRPVESGTFPLAHGASQRVGRLRAYGNAIVAQVAAEVIGAYLEAA